MSEKYQNDIYDSQATHEFKKFLGIKPSAKFVNVT